MENTGIWIAAAFEAGRLRAWAMRGTVALQRVETELSETATSGARIDGLLELFADSATHQGASVLASGLHRAADPVPVPAAPPGAVRPVCEVADAAGLRVIPGLMQAEPPDLLQGEETCLAGFLSRNPGWDGVACLPGPTTAWVHLSAGEIVSFQTVMSGTLFARTADALHIEAAGATASHEDAFAGAMAETLSRPERLAARLSNLRASVLLGSVDPGEARARLRGLLVGAELAATRSYWLGQKVAVIAPQDDGMIYDFALGQQGLLAERADAEDMMLAGLIAAHEASRH